MVICQDPGFLLAIETGEKNIYDSERNRIKQQFNFRENGFNKTINHVRGLARNSPEVETEEGTHHFNTEKLKNSSPACFYSAVHWMNLILFSTQETISARTGTNRNYFPGIRANEINIGLCITWIVQTSLHICTHISALSFYQTGPGTPKNILQSTMSFQMWYKQRETKILFVLSIKY